MKPLPQEFLTLEALYKEHGFSLWMIGGTSRDYLLGLEPDDLDFVTDATPEQEKQFLPEADYTFQKYGSIKAKVGGVSCDVTTLREESDYGDHRHPGKVQFIQDVHQDSLRRDFTINAIYIDGQGHVLDYHHGLDDLKAGVIRFIGEPSKRILEDPLRILRAERFAKRLGFTIEEASKAAMEQLRGELSKLNPDKVLLESKKV